MQPVYALTAALESRDRRRDREVLAVPRGRDRDEQRAEAIAPAFGARHPARPPLREIANPSPAATFRSARPVRVPLLPSRHWHAESDARSRAAAGRRGYFALDEPGS
jgi:hypothetical protein